MINGGSSVFLRHMSAPPTYVDVRILGGDSKAVTLRLFESVIMGGDSLVDGYASQ